jgi:NitT/TauT family transport system ATP-binding protein
MIQIKQISKKYEDNGHTSATILSEINLTIPKGQFVCLLGPSGCGKTTLLNLIAGFIKPSQGQILFNHLRVKGPGHERGVVFQDATLFPWLTVLQNVGFGLRQQGLNRHDRTKMATKYLHLVGMGHHKDAYPYTLSGGMRQRIAIARVLALEPQALLMDEPFSSLDINSREHLQDELLRVWDTHRRTLFYVTHSVEEAVYLADRVIIMGAAPKNIFSDIILPLKRPRTRLSPEFHRVTASLRASLDTLPCCIKPSNESSRTQ